MSSETSTDELQPWQLFTLAGLAGATAVVFATRDSGPAAVILLSLTVGAAAFVGVAAWRTLGPLAGVHHVPGTRVGGRTRAALERDKVLVLRAIKDLEFDRAMGKVSEKDFADMSARLRARATGLLRQLDRDAGYRDEIEREIARRLGAPPPPVVAGPPVSGTAARACACGTANDPDARFCKSCGSNLAAA
ncbi:MAG: hypothetical protein ACRD26_10855 [Vicinamibacterales bacterium]